MSPSPIKRRALFVSYDGSRFFGWQKQADGIATVQSALEAALSELAQERISVVTAGRTDTGVHATAQVVGDWMYESVANTYLLDEQNQEFLRHANPWALRSMVERLQESVDRGMWENPDPELINQLHELYLEVEGDLEE